MTISKRISGDKVTGNSLDPFDVETLKRIYQGCRDRGEPYPLSVFDGYDGLGSDSFDFDAWFGDCAGSGGKVLPWPTRKR